MATTKVKQISREQYEALVAVGIVAKASFAPPYTVASQPYGYQWIWRRHDELPPEHIHGMYYYTLVEADDD